MKPILATLVGAVAATGLILACSDDSPGNVDAAATCDCPAAEPPLAGRIVTNSDLPEDLLPNSETGALARCPVGATLLSGHCKVEFTGGTPPHIALYQYGPETDPLTWVCRWKNYDIGTAKVYAEAVCLMPSQ